MFVVLTAKWYLGHVTFNNGAILPRVNYGGTLRKLNIDICDSAKFWFFSEKVVVRERVFYLSG